MNLCKHYFEEWCKAKREPCYLIISQCRYYNARPSKVKRLKREDSVDRTVAAVQPFLMLSIVFLLLATAAWGDTYTDEQIADAIYRAENSTSHPYGILQHYEHTTPRQACINTIKSAKRRYEKANLRIDFIEYLGQTYCPVGCDNDNGTNKYWVRNVKFFLNKE